MDIERPGVDQCLNAEMDAEEWRERATNAERIKNSNYEECVRLKEVCDRWEKRARVAEETVRKINDYRPKEYLAESAVDWTQRMAQKVAEAPACPKVDTKPLRLLVEVVPQKDEKHGQSAHSRPLKGDWRAVEINTTGAMSVKELPPMRSLEDLRDIFWLQSNSWGDQGDAMRGAREGIRAVLKACGLEVSE